MIANFGKWILDNLEAWGRAVIFISQTIVACFKIPFRFNLFMTQMYQIGVNSTLVIALIGLFTGAVLAVQAEYTLSQFGATAYTGSAVALSLIRELGPVLTALMIIGRAGSAITAEIGIMKITEQVDALRSMAVDPIRYLMVPRLLAGLVAVPMLTGIFIVVGIFGGYVVSVGLLGLASGTYINVMTDAVTSFDVYSGFIKSFFFGFIFAWVACYKGFTSGFGAVGVNKATTQSVVTASVAVLVIDYFITTFLTQI